jgi:hypothetical protein
MTPRPYVRKLRLILGSFPQVPIVYNICNLFPSLRQHRKVLINLHVLAALGLARATLTRGVVSLSE